MNRLGWVESLVLVAFWVAGLAAFVIGGMEALGHVMQVFFVVAVLWVGKQLYEEYSESLKDEYLRSKAFSEWERRQHHLKGMDQ